MTRKPLALGLAGALLLTLSAQGAIADELPVRKAGLWEMTTARTGSAARGSTVQQCTDAATDKDMSVSASPLAKQICAKQDVQKTATGYTVDAVCGMAGVSITSHTEISGDFNSAYTVSTRSHTDKGPGGKPLDTVTRIEAKWLGACKPGQKPGDIMMPGGFKMNTKDIDKLKALIPGVK
jgi:hypothetical protein